MTQEDENKSELVDPTKKFDDLLEVSKEQGKRLVEYGHNFTETGQYIFDFSSALQGVVKSGRHNIDIEPLIHDVQLSNDIIGQSLSHIGKVDIPAVDSTAGTMTVSSGSIIRPGAFELSAITSDGYDLDHAIINLRNVISRYSKEDEVSNLLSELNFDQKIGGRESPRDRFLVAHEAYKKPVTSDNTAVTSLIPMREAIRGVIDELLKRRPTQEKASSEQDKILSIGTQLKRDSISNDLIKSWSQQWVLLLNHLSQAKEKNISRAEWLHLLEQATIFLKNLLNGLDPTKFRK